MNDNLRKTLSRRIVLKGGSASVLALAAVSFMPGKASADAKLTAEVIKKVIGSKALSEGKIEISAPQIAENGNTVPFSVSIDSPMTDSNHVRTVHIFAEGNPRPEVASFHFRPGSVAKVSSRMRMIKTQNIIAIAELNDGSVYSKKVKVKVTIGGCGG